MKRKLLYVGSMVTGTAICVLGAVGGMSEGSPAVIGQAVVRFTRTAFTVCFMQRLNPRICTIISFQLSCRVQGNQTGLLFISCQEFLRVHFERLAICIFIFIVWVFFQLFNLA